MEKQLIISVGREFGSGGHAIAELLAKRLTFRFTTVICWRKSQSAKA